MSHNTEAESYTLSALSRRYAAVPSLWNAWEMPQGVRAKLACALAYVGSRSVSSPRCACSVVVCTEWTVNVSTFLGWEVYDTGRLWSSPPLVLDELEPLPLRCVLGADGYADPESIVALIDRVKRHQVPLWHNNHPTCKNVDQCSGRTSEVGDVSCVGPMVWGGGYRCGG